MRKILIFSLVAVAFNCQAVTEQGTHSMDSSGDPRAAQPVQLAQNDVPEVSASAIALDPRMDKVVKLIHTSSGARQVNGSDNPEAHGFHQQAKDLFRQALNASSKEDASKLLNESIKTMYSAIRAASPSSVMAEKKQRDFDKLHRSVDTFMEQHERISEEKQHIKEGKQLRSQVTTLVAEAEVAFKTDPAKAQVVLRSAFEMLRNDIEVMRGGQTLIRSLNFATKKEEYDYELERYKSQRVLVDVLLRDKMESSAYVAKQVSAYIKVAEEQRTIAESEAGNGNYEAAIAALGKARKQIVRSLRTGGIYVPG
ncbi:MAG: hypothetical protein V7739_15410 [Motiliproteus sp.]